ncbi:unnamed protein product [Peniophora sp. CBMAI 1063]|nr:unnamed protein product [Peniophora sp. CBMAI 1063]
MSLNQLQPHPVPDPTQYDAKERWRQALEDYDRETNQNLLQQPFTQELLSQSSAEAVALRLQGFMDYRSKGHKILAVMESIASVILRFIEAGAEAASKFAPGGKAIFVGFAALLQAMRGVTELYDAVEFLFQKVKHYVERVEIHLGPPGLPIPAITKILFDTLTQVLRFLAIVTKYCNDSESETTPPWRRLKSFRDTVLQRTNDYFSVMLDKTDLPAVLKKLDALAKAEIEMTAAHTNAMMRAAQPKMLATHDSIVLNDIRSWLQPPNPQPLNYEKKRYRDSCTWFFDDRFDDWHSSRNGIYWVYGNAGAGKSVLCSSVIDRVKADRTLTLAYYYFDFSDPEKKGCRGLLASLVFQIGTYLQESLDYLKKEQLSCRSDDHPTSERLLDMLSCLLRISGRTVLIIDALDECPESARSTGLFPFIEMIRDLKDVADCCLLATSRPEADLRNCMLDLATHSKSFHDDVRHNNDIRAYISAQLSQTNTYYWAADSRLQKKALSVVDQKSHGMFLWVDLQLRALRHCSKGDVEHVLLDLPGDLDDTYGRILREFPDRGSMVHSARRVFECIASAQWPLSVMEVFHILSANVESPQVAEVLSDAEVTETETETETETDSGESSHYVSSDEHIDHAKDIIRKACPTLLDIVVTDGRRETVQFIHFSVKEYLMSQREHSGNSTVSHGHGYMFDARTANITFAKVCLRVLCGDPLRPPVMQDYAVLFWHNHVGLSRGHEDNQLNSQLSSFLRLDSPSFARLTRALATSYLSYWMQRPHDLSGHMLSCHSALHAAAGLGLQKQVDQMLDRCSREKLEEVIDARDWYTGTPLHSAVVRGHIGVSRSLLDHGASINIPGGFESKKTQLEYAISGGNINLIRLMMRYSSVDDSGARIPACHIRNKYGETVCHLAAVHRDVNVLHTVLEYGALVDVEDNEVGNTPLHDAVREGLLGIVSTLLAQPASDGCSDPLSRRCSARNWDNETALCVAVRRGHVGIARYLLPYTSFDDNGSNGEQVPPLQHAVAGRHLDCVRLLLNHPPANESNAAALRYNTWSGLGTWCGNALHCAAEGGNIDILNLLLAQPSVRIDYTDSDGSTLLHHAVSSSKLDIVRTVIECGSLHDVLGYRGWLPLHEATDRGQLESVRMLLTHPRTSSTATFQCRTKVKLGFGNDLEHNATALHIAAENGHVDICRILIEHGSLLNETTSSGETPLHSAERMKWARHGMENYIATIRFLLEARATSVPVVTPLDPALSGRLRARAESDPEDGPWRAIFQDFASQFAPVPEAV